MGWPEAPSSPLQGRGVLLAVGAGCARAAVAGFWPEKMLPSRFEIPSPDDWARASPANRSAVASTTAPARLIFDGPVRTHVSVIPQAS